MNQKKKRNSPPKQQQTPSTTPKSPQVNAAPELLEAIDYNINGITYTQDYLTIPETIQITKLFKNFDFEKIKDPWDLVEQLTQKGVFEAFVNTILKGDKHLRIKDLRPAMALRIISDFFLLNEVSEIIAIIISRLPSMGESISKIGMR